MSYGSEAAKRIAGKTVLITGASSGIGEAIALELAAAAKGELRLIISARRRARLEELKKKLEAAFDKVEVLALELDVSDFAQIPARIAALPKEWAQIDILVNNAGLGRGSPEVGSLKVEDIQSTYFTNVVGLVVLTNLVTAQMRERNSGDIVITGSLAAWEAYPGGSVYASSKACVQSFAEALRKENIANKLRVIEVDPGLVETEFALSKFDGDAERARKAYEGYEPLSPLDVAEIVAFSVTRRENTVVANTLIVPTNQATAAFTYRK